MNLTAVEAKPLVPASGLNGQRLSVSRSGSVGGWVSREQPWVMRDFTVFDPSGVLWRIAQNLLRSSK